MPSASPTHPAMAAMRLPSLLKASQLVAIVILLSEIKHGVGLMNEDGVVKPSDPFKFVGETLILFCNITTDKFTADSRDLFFEKKKGKDTTKIDPSNIEILTTKSVRLRLPNVRLEDDGIYTCLLKTYNGLKYIGHQIVKVDYKPIQISNISCRVMNWESMTCNWTLGVEYQHMEDLNVSLVWTVDGKQKYCPRMAANKTSCTWWSSKDYWHNHKYIMRIEVANLRRSPNFTVLSPQFNVETRLYENSSHDNETGIVVVATLEPAPVTNLMAIIESSRCIALSWQHSSDRMKVFILQYRPLDGTQWEKLYFNQEERMEMKTTVCGLNPDTDYFFRVKVMPVPEFPSDPKQRNGFSSPWKNVSAKTDEDVPEAAPQMCSSCFVERACHREIDALCPLVTIYWKDIPLEKRNGQITGYRVSLAEKGDSSSPVVDVDASQKNLQYFADVRLPSRDKEYTLTLKARTKVGYSNQSSRIVIPSKTSKTEGFRDFVVKKNKTEDGKDIYWLTWDDSRTRGSRNEKIIIVWCFGTIPDFTCKGEIHWIPLPTDKVNHNFIPDVEDKARGNLIVGIAREVYNNSKTYSSGIQWASCIYHKNGKNPSPPRNVRVTSVPQISGLRVDWETNSCPNDLVYVIGYRISVCRTEDKKKCIANQQSVPKHVKNIKDHVDFPNLIANAQYLVYVLALSDTGYGMPSEPVVGTVTEDPKGDDGSSEKNAIRIIIIVIGVLILLFFLIVCCRIWRCWVTRRAKLPSWKPPLSAQSPQSRYLIENLSVQARPLPAVPTEDPQYGANSRACMMNHGSDSDRQGIISGSSRNGTNVSFREKMFSDETTHRPLKPHPNHYETNFGMFPLPNANEEESDLVESDHHYLTPESGIETVPFLSSMETLKQSAPQANSTDFATSLASSGSSGHSSYIPHHQHAPSTSAEFFPLSESPPPDEAPLPPSLSVGNNLPSNQMNEQNSDSPPSLSHVHSHPSNPDPDPDHSINVMPPLGSDSNPITEIPPSVFGPTANPVPSDFPRVVPSQPSRSLEGHSNTSDSSVSNEYFRMVPYEPPDSHSVAPNVTSRGPYVPNGLVGSCHPARDVGPLPVPDYFRLVPSDVSGYPQTSNGFPIFVPSETRDHPEKTGCTTFDPYYDAAPGSPTSNVVPRIVDHPSLKSHGWPMSNGSSLPNGHSNVPKANGMTLSNFRVPPPPPYPPPSPETVV